MSTDTITKRFTYASGYSGNGVTAETAAAALDAIIEENDGQITPDLIVERSEPETAPLHPVFEWDNELAGARWRRQQARNLINHVEVTYIAADGEERPPIRYYASVRPAELKLGESGDFARTVTTPGETPARVYVTIRDALSDNDMRAQLIERALAEVAAWRRRYSQYQELAGLLGAIDAQLSLMES